MKLYELVEQTPTRPIRFTFGRFNPPHIGHKKLLDAVALGGEMYKIFPSRTQDKKKNPLDPDTKIRLMGMLFPEHEWNIVNNPSLKTIIQIMQRLATMTKNVTMVVGDDRVAQFERLLNSYNGKEYTFDTINVESAGIRDPDAVGVEGASATKVRDAVIANDYKTFEKYMPPDHDATYRTWIHVRDKMGLGKIGGKLGEQSEQNKPTVYIDMDGVLSDFFTEYAKLAGIKDGDYRKIPSAAIDPTLNKMVGTDFFNRLPKIGTANKLIQLVTKFTGGDYSILSSPLRGDKDNSTRWKKVWIARELPIQPKEVLVTGRKESYATQSNGNPNILIDDRGKNVERWRSAGGFGIKYQADEDSLDMVVNGLKQYAKATA